jgi:hypothetical protein
MVASGELRAPTHASMMYACAGSVRAFNRRQHPKLESSRRNSSWIELSIRRCRDDGNCREMSRGTIEGAESDRA